MLMCQGGLKILRMDIQTGRGHDEIALAAGEDEFALSIARGQVTGVQPAFFGVACLRLPGTPLRVGDGISTDEDLSDRKSVV